MNHQELNQLFLSNFAFGANPEQAAFFADLSKFIFSKSHQCFLLSGYAGTGKTTVIKSVVDTYRALNGNIVLLAPTGRASKVLSQRTGQSASTIHRYIYTPRISGGSTSYVVRANTKKHTLFVVDEASMIADTPSDGAFGQGSLLDDLMEFVQLGHLCKVLFIGDSAQLPPVGLDISPAMDAHILANRYAMNVAEAQFTQVIRQAQESGILKNATQIRNLINEDIFEAPKISPSADVIRLTDPYEMEEVFQKCFGDSERENGIMIVRSNKRANQYNLDIRARIQFKDDILNTSDQLMVVKNNYHWLPKTAKAQFIANGDTIEILSLRNREQLYGHTFTDATIQLLDYPDEAPIDVKIMLDVLQIDGSSLTQQQMENLFEAVVLDYQNAEETNPFEKAKEDPYANALQVKFSHVVTCHKAQGGQWPLVIIEQCWLPDGEVDKEYLRWLYTAFTRAEEKVYLVGFDDSYFTEDS